ncbi:BolA family protein [Rodentibacter caecimuris]|uniref:Transcriptional regulator n=1 Tax=Rodentibacter caecimuris TaxID=1796644 RepID=A0ABX3L105_9PAST|nr:transcriptional regulator [Rodentibacter heylii]
MSKQQELTERLQTVFQPSFLLVENESHMHSSGKGANSHFKCVVVSEKFDNLHKVRRHQLVYQLFAEELKNGIHALALHLYSPSEWSMLNQQFPNSPRCIGIGQ